MEKIGNGGAPSFIPEGLGVTALEALAAADSALVVNADNLRTTRCPAGDGVTQVQDD